MKQRIITGIAAGVVFVGLCVLGGWPYQLLLTAMALIGYYEFVRMIGFPAMRGTALLGYAAVAALTLPWGRIAGDFSPSWLQSLWLLLLLFLLITVFSKNKVDIKTAALLYTGAVYIGTGFAFISQARAADESNGLFWTLLLLACIWGSDAGAYFVGRALGKNKLWPAISPNKTVEGALGGVAISVVVAIGFSFIQPAHLELWRALLIGLSSAVIGQLGDLVQSAYKRVYSIKDSGKLLPGHGGILDRCDSWLVVFPFVHIVMLMPY